MKNEEVENMDFGAERRSVVQNQGSRDSGAERTFHRKIMQNRCKIHPKIDGKSMQNRCSKKLCKNDGKWEKMESKREPKSIKIRENRYKN